MKRLNVRQEAFAKAVAAGHSASAAYAMAGFKPNGANAHRLSRKESVRTRIDSIKAEMSAVIGKAAEETGISVAATLTELGRIAFSDIRELFTEEGALIPAKKWPDEIAHAVASVEVVTKAIRKDGNPEVEHVHKIKLWDKNAALEKIAKHLQMFVGGKELEGGIKAEFARLIKQVVNADAALPVGSQRSALRVVSDNSQLPPEGNGK